MSAEKRRGRMGKGVMCCLRSVAQLPEVTTGIRYPSRSAAVRQLRRIRMRLEMYFVVGLLFCFTGNEMIINYLSEENQFYWNCMDGGLSGNS